MARTKVLFVGFLLSQILLTQAVSQTWINKKLLNFQCFSGSPLRTVSRSPLFLSAIPILTVFPKVEEPPIKPFTDAIYTPESIEITETLNIKQKTESILHKLHKVIEDLLEEEKQDDVESNINEEPEISREELSSELEDTYNEVGNDNDSSREVEESSEKEASSDIDVSPVLDGTEYLNDTDGTDNIDMDQSE